MTKLGQNISVTDYVCTTDEFDVNTNAENGSTLITVNTETNSVENYYIAYEGKWYKL